MIVFGIKHFATQKPIWGPFRLTGWELLYCSYSREKGQKVVLKLKLQKISKKNQTLWRKQLVHVLQIFFDEFSSLFQKNNQKV